MFFSLKHFYGSVNTNVAGFPQSPGVQVAKVLVHFLQTNTLLDVVNKVAQQH